MEHRVTVVMAVLVALTIVANWKAVIRIIIIVPCIVVMATLGYAVITALQNAHHIVM